MGWKITGQIPAISKCVIIVVPHTHWMDFLIGLFVRSAIGLEINFIGKKELFDSPFGWLFRWLGGAPVNRAKNHNTVDQVVRLFKTKETFRLALSPEGTRKKVAQWRSGFYHIAHLAQVPIIPVSFDFPNKEVKINPAFATSGNYEADTLFLKKYFKGVLGKIAENS